MGQNSRQPLSVDHTKPGAARCGTRRKTAMTSPLRTATGVVAWALATFGGLSLAEAQAQPLSEKGLAPPGQAWPVKPVRVIVPFVPGGTADTLGRIVATRLTESLGQTFVIDN